VKKVWIDRPKVMDCSAPIDLKWCVLEYVYSIFTSRSNERASEGAVQRDLSWPMYPEVHEKNTSSSLHKMLSKLFV
jgi:hypothetical protein